jgi:hypothetical protein
VHEEIERAQDDVCREHRFLPLGHTAHVPGACEARRG